MRIGVLLGFSSLVGTRAVAMLGGLMLLAFGTKTHDDAVRAQRVRSQLAADSTR
jgi:hypothetical protein